MKTLLLILFGLLNVAYLPISPNCSCDWEGPVLEMSQESDLVVRLKVLEHQKMMEIYEDSIPNAMIVEILEIYQGEEERKQLKVWGDNGFLCRPYLSMFPIGSEWVLSLQKGEQIIEGAEKEDFSISICGETVLPVKDGQLEGVIFSRNVIKGTDGFKVHTQKLSLSGLKEAFGS